MTKHTSFEGLYREQLQELYDAERQIIDAMPGMILAADSADLKSALQIHLDQTKEQMVRMQQLLTAIQEKPGSKLCEGMRGLLSEGKLLSNEVPPSPVLDAALIASAQKVEHYEIAGYKTASSMAEMLNHPKSAAVLRRTLAEEEDADATLSEVAETVMGGEDLEAAVEAEEGGEEREKLAS